MKARNPRRRAPEARAREAVIAGALGGGIGLVACSLGLPALFSFWGSSAPVVAGAALAGAATGWALGERSGRRAVGSALVALELLYVVVVATPLSASLVRELVRADSVPSTADAIYVFASSIHGDGTLTDVALSRLVHGFEVVGSHHADRVVVGELPPPYRSYAEAARSLARKLGLKVDIVGVGPVLRSRDEAVEVARLFREHHWKRVIAVTSPTHSRRACASLEHEGLEVVCSPAAESRFDLSTLKKADDRLRAFAAGLHERVGLWYYRKKGWI